VDAALQGIEKMEEGSGAFNLIAGISNNVGRLDARLDHRVSDSISIFASAGTDTSKQWEALTGVRVTW
tara:strand:- start:3506 stop:3709 length:204 start_codon:yes stop_codon:yes gene_type:complete